MSLTEPIEIVTGRWVLRDQKTGQTRYIIDKTDAGRLSPTAMYWPYYCNPSGIQLGMDGSRTLEGAQKICADHHAKETAKMLLNKSAESA